MVNRPTSIRVRKYAKREMQFNNSQHAVYGLSYVSQCGNIVERLAKTPNEIKYFYTNDSFNTYIDLLHSQFDENQSLNIYAVHKN